MHLQGLAKRSTLLIAVGAFHLWMAADPLHKRPAAVGDEITYLLTAHSLVVDGDLVMNNNYRDRDSRHFADQRPGRRVVRSPSGQAMPALGPALSWLIAPTYMVCNWLGWDNQVLFWARATMAIVTAICALLFLSILLQFGIPAIASWWISFLLFVGPPLTLQGTALFPEMPVAASILALLAVSHRKNKSLLFTPANLIVFLALVLLPFWGVKYWPFAIGLSVWLIYLMIIDRDAGRRYRLMLVSIGVGLLLVLLYHRWLYGSFSPLASYGYGNGQMAIATSFAGLWQRLSRSLQMALAYIWDPQNGILLLQPFLWTAVVGLLLLRRVSRRLQLSVLLLFLPFTALVLFHSSLDGFCAPGRHFVAVVPLVAIGWIGWLHKDHPHLPLSVVAGWSIWVFWITALMVLQPRLFIQAHRWALAPEPTHWLTFWSTEWLDWNRFFPRFVVDRLGIETVIGLAAAGWFGYWLYGFAHRKSQGVFRIFDLGGRLASVALGVLPLLMWSGWFLGAPRGPGLADQSGRTVSQMLFRDAVGVYRPADSRVWLEPQKFHYFAFRGSGECQLRVTSRVDNSLRMRVAGKETSIDLTANVRKAIQLPSLAPGMNSHSGWLFVERGIVPAFESQQSFDFRRLGIGLRLSCSP